MNYHLLIKNALEKDKQRGMIFTNDWFHGGSMIDIENNVKLGYDEPVHLLEIGAFEGKSTVWFSEKYLRHKDSTMTVIDPFLTSDTTTRITDTTYDYFCQNVKKSINSDKITVVKDLSEKVLPILFVDKKEYDIIFIDGSHLHKDIILDLILSWKMLKKNGYVILDDYTNNGGVVKDVVEFWLNKCLKQNEWDILHDKYQIIIKKN